MKVIVTGATGSVGKEIVKQCIADPRITKITILTRRAVTMDIESDPKAEVVMHQDFARYSDELLRRLEGASACLWAITSTMEKCNDDKELFQRITIEYPLAAAAAMCERLAPKLPTGSKFNFILCPARDPDRHASKALLFLGDSRRHRSEAEKRLCELADAHPRSLSPWILKPSGHDTPKRRHRLVGSLAGTQATVEPAQLARAFVRVACEGWKDRVIDNDALLKM